VVAIRATGCRPNSATRSVGVVIGPDLVATVAHSVAGETAIEVWIADGRTESATIAAIDPELDAAILRVPGVGLDAVTTADHRGTRTPAVFVAMRERTVEVEPVVIARAVTVETTDIYGNGEVTRPGFELADATIDPGDSGGGVFLGRSLVAIVWAASRDDGGRAWATAASVYEQLLERVGSSPEGVASVPCAR
jgi:S1-C subfamily serine protease